MKLTKKQKKQLLSLLVLLILLAVSTFLMPGQEPEPETSPATVPGQVPDFSGQPWATLGDNIPDFTDDEKARTASFEEYSPLDSLGRCGVTMACIGMDLMPTEDRGSIETLIIYRWNRRYPADNFLNIDLKNYKLISSRDFPGSSHESITKEVYVK